RTQHLGPRLGVIDARGQRARRQDDNAGDAEEERASEERSHPLPPAPPPPDADIPPAPPPPPAPLDAATEAAAGLMPHCSSMGMVSRSTRMAPAESRPAPVLVSMVGSRSTRLTEA